MNGLDVWHAANWLRSLFGEVVEPDEAHAPDILEAVVPYRYDHSAVAAADRCQF